MRWFLLLLATVAITLSANAASIVPIPANQPVQISAQLNKTAFIAAEPINVTVTLTNTGQKDVWLGGSADELSTFRFVVKDADGTEMKPTDFGRHVTSHIVTAFSNAAVPLPPGQKRYIIFPLQQMFYLEEGGTFSLVVSRGIPLEAVEIAPNQYRHDWYTLLAEPVRFSVSSSKALYDLTFSNPLLARTRLEVQSYWNGKPVWVALNSENGNLPHLEVIYLGANWSQLGNAPRKVPFLAGGGSLMAKAIASDRPSRLDIARIFDLSQPGEYILKLLPIQGTSRELHFKMLDTSPDLHASSTTPNFLLEERLSKRDGLLQPHALDAQGNAIVNPEIF